MRDLSCALSASLSLVLDQFGVGETEVSIQEVPLGKPGDFGTPVAFGLARVLRKSPTLIAEEIVERIELPNGVLRAEAVGPYINFSVDPGPYVRSVIELPLSLVNTSGTEVIVEHTSVNPNKETHIGHVRNIVLGDTVARILAAAGHTVEVQNYVDDTGRQAAESLFAIDYFGARYDGEGKYDRWLGDLYVQLGKAKEDDGEVIDRGVDTVMRRLERGELRAKVEAVVRAQLETCYALGAEYDLLVWESDIVRSGFLDRGLKILRGSEYVSRPTEGRFAGALVMDVSAFIPGLEEPNVVLVRSDGNAMYVAKDIGYQFWKAGLFKGLNYRRFDTQPSGRPLYTSAPDGEPEPGGRRLVHAQEIVNVIGVEQSHPQTLVRAALALSDSTEGLAASKGSRHLAYELVSFEGQTMSGRKGIALPADEVIEEAVGRARAVIKRKNPDLGPADEVARQVGVGALRFAMLKSEARRVIDFRWEQALSLQGDSAPYAQYAHARACSILRSAPEVLGTGADWRALGELEVRLAQVVARLPQVVAAAARDLAPHLVTQYVLDLATAWNGYYNHKDDEGRPDTQILRSAPGLREARLALVTKVRDTLAASLDLLGVEAPEQM